MPGSVNESNATLTSYTQKDENGRITPRIPPTPALRNTGQRTDETPSPVPPKSQDLLDPNTQVPPPSPSQIKKDDPTHVLWPPEIGSTSLGLGGSSGNESEEFPYATINFNAKSSKKSLSNDSGVGNQSLKESPYEENIYEDPYSLDFNKTLDELDKEFTNNLITPFTPKDDSNIESSKADSETPLISSSKKPNRIRPRVEYAMGQKSFVIPVTSAIVLGTSAALVYLQDKAKFIAFFTNSPKYVTITVIALASLLAIIPIFCAIKQFRNTEEHQIQGKNADGILDEVLKHQPEGKIIQSVILKYGNNTHSDFMFNTWKAKNNFINIDEKVISRTNKIKSIINDRPLFTALLTGFIVANVALPLGLYEEGGMSNITTFYQNILATNIGLSLLVSSSVIALSILCLGVHYYNKTNCTNLVYPREHINPEEVNGEIVGAVKRIGEDALKENHIQDGKCASLELRQVVVKSHNFPDVVYGVGRSVA
ncbi:hypothetical protein [Wolbachia endosymbiont of Cantharis cryptica]|uniref:hypothetical protein n=1 Tax=Wolbachia endosymbiont of Cantharis cryptica TaxID=3066132 RepID=UPI00376F3CBF